MGIYTPAGGSVAHGYHPLTFNNINKKLAERNRIKHTDLTLRDITKKCFKIIAGKHLSNDEIHALDAYVRTLK